MHERSRWVYEFLCRRFVLWDYLDSVVCGYTGVMGMDILEHCVSNAIALFCCVQARRFNAVFCSDL